MDNWDFINIDSGKGEKLLDLAAFHDWQIKQLEEDSSIGVTESMEPTYSEMKMEAKRYCDQLKDSFVNLTPTQARRLFQYLQGQSLEEIASSETPRVNRQTVNTTLVRICKKRGWNLGQIAKIWQYGTRYLE